MRVLMKIKEFLKKEWEEARVPGRLVYLYYLLFFIAEAYYITHIHIVTNY